MHRRPRLGDRHQLRHPRAAGDRLHHDRRRGRVRRGALVRDAGARAGHRLVHRPHGDPDDDEGGRRAGARPRPLLGPLHGERRRALEPGGGDLVGGGLRAAVPRQLVADRDRRHHDRQLRRGAGQARLHGPAAAGNRGGDRPPQRPGRSVGRRHGGRGGRRDRGAGAETRLAVDDARLPAPAGTLRQGLRRRLVPFRRPGDARRRRLVLVRRPGRRRDQRPPAT